MLGTAIRQIRTNQGLKQADLAERLHTTQVTISRWERTGQVPYTRIQEIAEALGVNQVDIYQAASALEAPSPQEDDTRHAPRC